jgi:type IX secretion system PorP/SprF family membrane protein
MVLGQAKAQDPHFSQFFSSPLSLNPAFTGYFEGMHRLGVNFRHQWIGAGEPFTTATVGFDTHFSTLGEKDNIIGLGVMAIGDRTANGAYNSNYASFSGAYHQVLDEDGYQHLGLGIQANLGSKMLDMNRISFNTQFGNRGFDLSMSNGENFVSRSASYFDLNAGLLYNYLFDRKRIYAGVSYYHLGQPKISFLGNDDYFLKARLTIHGGASFLVGEQGEVFASAQSMFQGGVNTTTLGVSYGYSPGHAIDRTVFYGGLYLRYNDAVYPYVGYMHQNLKLGLSYDVNISGVQTGATRNKSYELSLVYFFRQKNDEASKYMPWY